LLNFIFKIINLIAFLLLLLAFSASYISPASFWTPAFFGLIFPYLFLLNILLFIFHAIRVNKRAILPAIGLIICFSSFNLFFKPFGKNEVPKQIENDNQLRVMSFNVRLFDVYKWSDKPNAKALILKLINQYQPDVLCLQEFYYEKQGKFMTLDILKKELNMPYLHVENSAVIKKNHCFGIVTLSKYPIFNKKAVNFEKGTDNLAIYTDIIKGEDTLRCFNMHLESIRFRSEDYNTLEQITGLKDNTDLDGERKIIGRMKRAFQTRATQAESIAEHIKNTQYKTFVCGDFNDTPGSYAYRKVKGNLTDAFSRKGKNTGASYISRIPFLRIDYIFFDADYFQCTAMERVNVQLSDHFPIVADFQSN